MVRQPGIPAIDTLAHAQLVIDTVHERHHQGEFFSASAFDLALPNNGEINIYIVPTAPMHLQAHGILGGDGFVQIAEDPAVSDAGTPLPAYNRNRISDLEAKATLFTSPTISDEGTIIGGPIVMAGGFGPLAPGAASGNGNEWILSDSHTYMVKLTNKGGVMQIAGLDVAWYHPGLSLEAT